MYRRLLLASVSVVALAGSALAADLPSRAPPPVYVPPAPIFTWTGVYVGGQIGYAWTTGNATVYDSGVYNTGAGSENGPTAHGFYDLFNLHSNASGVIGGAHVGYNLQINQFVVGLEGDVDGSSLSKTWNGSFYSGYYNFYNGAAIPASVHADLGIQGSIRGRVGYAWDRVLLYATGGVAFGGFNGNVTTNFPIFYNTNFGVSGGYDSFSQTRVGWTVGGGLEYAVTNNWSIRAEYRYTDFGNTTTHLVNAFPVLLSGDFINASVHRNLAENRVEVGFSYKFDTAAPAPVVAKY
jgi:outer membrane immunogenic protein